MKASRQVRGWLVRGQNAKGKQQQQDKSGGQKDLQQALLEDPGDKGGKAKSKGKEDQSTDDDEDDEKDENKSMAQIFAGGGDDDEEDDDKKKSSEDDDDEEDEKKKTEEEDEDDDSSSDLKTPISDKYKDLEKQELPPGTSPRAAEKFKTIKKQAKEAVADLKKIETEKVNLQKEYEKLKAEKGSQSTDEFEKHPEVIALKKQLSEKDETIEKLNLEDSPRFQAKYDAPRLAIMRKKIRPITALIEDKDQHDAVTAGIQAALSVAAGEDNDEKFYRALDRVQKMEGFPASRAARFEAEMEKIRELYNEREEAVSNWQQTSKAMRRDEEASGEETSKRYQSAFHLVRKQFIDKNKENFEKLIENEEVFGYKRTTDPIVKEVEKELEIVAKTGALTPKIMGLIQGGVEHVFIADMLKKMQGLLTDAYAQVRKYKKKAGIKDEKIPAKGAKDKTKREDSDDDDDSSSGYGISGRLAKIGQ